MGRILIGNIKGPQGEAGKNFEYAKTYASVSAMNADFSGTDVAEGEYVVISAGIDDADNGRVYRKGTSSYVYVNRVNGPTGPRGATGPMPTLVTNLDTTTAGQGALDASVGPTIKGKVTKEGGETGDTVTTFNTSDTTTDAEIIEYTDMAKLTSGSPLKTLMSIMSKAVKNVRWFQKLLGTTDISGIGNGTVTNAVSTLNDALANAPTHWIAMTQENFGQFDNTNKFFKSLSALPVQRANIKTISVIPTNGAAILGAYVNSDGYVMVMGIVPSSMATIGSSYQFRVWIGY